MTPSQRSSAARARASTASSPASDSAIERLTFLRLCVSDADRNTLTSSNGRRAPAGVAAASESRSASALSSPRSLGISTDTLTLAGTSMLVSTSRASASCGITSGRTKLVTSMRCRPVRTSDLALRGDRLGLVLKPVARTHLPDQRHPRQRVRGASAGYGPALPLLIACTGLLAAAIGHRAHRIAHHIDRPPLTLSV